MADPIALPKPQDIFLRAHRQTLDGLIARGELNAADADTIYQQAIVPVAAAAAGAQLLARSLPAYQFERDALTRFSYIRRLRQAEIIDTRADNLPDSIRRLTFQPRYTSQEAAIVDRHNLVVNSLLGSAQITADQACALRYDVIQPVGQTPNIEALSKAAPGDRPPPRDAYLRRLQATGLLTDDVYKRSPSLAALRDEANSSAATGSAARESKPSSLRGTVSRFINRFRPQQTTPRPANDVAPMTARPPILQVAAPTSTDNYVDTPTRVALLIKSIKDLKTLEREISALHDEPGGSSNAISLQEQASANRRALQASATVLSQDRQFRAAFLGADNIRTAETLKGADRDRFEAAVGRPLWTAVAQLRGAGTQLPPSINTDQLALDLMRSPSIVDDIMKNPDRQISGLARTLATRDAPSQAMTELAKLRFAEHKAGDSTDPIVRADISARREATASAVLDLHPVARAAVTKLILAARDGADVLQRLEAASTRSSSPAATSSGISRTAAHALAAQAAQKA